MHLLELVRTDNSGRINERVSRWVNRPGIEPELLVSGGCDEKTLVCDFGMSWAHPQKLDPKKLLLQLDGTKRWEGVAHGAKFTIARGAKPQVVSCDAEFPDGTRATYTRTLFAFNPEEAQATLVSLPVISGPEAESTDDFAARLKDSGVPVRTVEETEPEVTFVMDAHALDAMVETSVTARGFRVRRWPAFGSAAFAKVHVVFPEESLPAETLALERLGSVSPSGRRASLSRWADAVAAAGYSLGGSPRRRAVVLVLSGFDRPNGSSFTAAQARAYLAEVMVPLVVWRIGNVGAPEWPPGPILANRGDVVAALDDLRAAVDRQRILWLEGFHDMRHLGRWLVPGVALAGRDPAAAPVPLDGPPRRIGEGSGPALGPDGGPVHALAAAVDGEILYAGTHGGVFRSRDGGDRWERASVGLPIAPVRCLAVSPVEHATVYAGTDAGLFVSRDAGGHWAPAHGELGAIPVASVSLDAAAPRVLFVGTSGRGVLRSDDAGETLLATALGHGDIRGLVVEPKGREVVAAAEDGVFRSADRGLTWTAAGRLPARALALGLEPGGVLFAATDGRGLFSSADAGATWRPAGLASTIVTSVGFGPAGTSLMLAGCPDGILVSKNGGGAWKLARLGAIEALAAGTRALLAGSSRGVLRAAEPSGVWRSSNTGLAASIVSSVVGAGSGKGVLYATSPDGLHRLGNDASTWTAVAGIPDGVVPEAVVALPPSSADLCVGTTGGIGRSENSMESWSFAPTHAAFQFATDPSQPDLLLAAGRVGVLRSEDGGRHWGVAANGMEKTFALQLGHHPADPQTFYAATAGNGVYRSVDAGRSWKPGGPALVRRITRSAAVDSGRREVVFAGTDSGVFRSGNGGADWLTASEGLPRAPVYALVADPRCTGVVYAGTAQGLFRTDDGGLSWEVYPADGLGAAVISLWIDPDAKALVAGTLGAGVFRVPLPDANPAQ